VLVEFYANWCGDCAHFAPKYKRLAKYVSEWRSVVKLAAIDCHKDFIYEELCSKHFDVVQEFPTTKMFPARTLSGVGIEIDHEFKSLLEAIIHQVEDASGIHRPSHFPTFKSLSDDFSAAGIEEMFATQPGTDQIVISFQDDPQALLAKEIALDLLDMPEVKVYSAGNSSVLAKQYGGQTPNTVVLIERLGQRIIGRSREEVKQLFKPTPDVTTTTTEPTTALAGSTTTAATSHNITAYEVYEADLETALQHSFRIELSGTRSFSGEELDALKSYVKLLAKYFPGRNVVRNWLLNLRRHLRSVDDSLDHVRYQTLVHWGSEKAFLPKKWHYVGCEVSGAGKRGYPCSLWTLFHALTVSAYHRHHKKTSPSSPKFKPEEVLEGITKYVKNFFGCKDCRQHFVAMASEPRSICNYGDSVLWLWHAHNRVNLRTKGSLTEDPKYPKQLFPNAKNCPHCRAGKHKGLPIWNLGNVLNFLGRMYSQLRFDAAPTVMPWTPASASNQTRSGPYQWLEYEGEGAVYNASIC